MTASDIQVKFKMGLGNAIQGVDGTPILAVDETPILDMGFAEVRTRTAEGITLTQGMAGGGMDDLVADVGSIDAVLPNADGRYTIDDPSTLLPAFREGLSVMLELSQASTVNRTRGRIRRIGPDAGNYGRRSVEVSAQDWMREADSLRPRQMPVQFNQRDDQLLELLLANMDTPPFATDFDLGADEYPYALHTFQDENAFAIGVMQAIAQSGMGRIYVRSDATYGETLVYENRHRRFEDTTPVATISDEMQDVRVLRDPLNRVRKVRVHFNPVRVDPAATTRLYRLPREIVLQPGETRQLPAMRYLDPLSAPTRVSALDLSAEYAFSSRSGQGDDLHGEISFAHAGVAGIQFGANSAAAAATNNADVVGHLHTLDIFGRGIYLYTRDAREAVNANLKIGREVDFVMPFNASALHAQHVADELLERWGTPRSEVHGVRFDAARNAVLAEAMLVGNIGKRVTLQEAKTNLDADFFIQGRRIGPITHRNKVPVVWTVTPAFEGIQGWILEVAGRSELPDAGGENGTTQLWL